MSTGWRIVDCLNLEGQIKYERGQLQVKRSGTSAVNVPLVQVAVLLLGLHASISTAALMRLAEEDVVVMVCDWRGIPVSVLTPWNSHSRVAARQNAQISLSKPRQKQAWQQIVKSKIIGQSNNLPAVDRREMQNMAAQVRSNDSTNREAIAARYYWQNLIGDPLFSRIPGSNSGYNALFDYAYTVLRGHGIRAVCSAGLIPALGIFHHGRSNPFCLVDDLIEPFRPAVDHYILHDLPGLDLATPEVKKHLAATVIQPFNSGGKSIETVLVDFAQQFGTYCENPDFKISVPVWKGIRRGKFKAAG